MTIGATRNVEQSRRSRAVASLACVVRQFATLMMSMLAGVQKWRAGKSGIVKSCVGAIETRNVLTAAPRHWPKAVSQAVWVAFGSCRMPSVAIMLRKICADGVRQILKKQPPLSTKLIYETKLKSLNDPVYAAWQKSQLALTTPKTFLIYGKHKRENVFSVSKEFNGENLRLITMFHYREAVQMVAKIFVSYIPAAIAQRVRERPKIMLNEMACSAGSRA